MTTYYLFKLELWLIKNFKNLLIKKKMTLFKHHSTNTAQRIPATIKRVEFIRNRLSMFRNFMNGKFFFWCKPHLANTTQKMTIKVFLHWSTWRNWLSADVANFIGFRGKIHFMHKHFLHVVEILSTKWAFDFFWH